jgi:hypothetical protein
MTYVLSCDIRNKLELCDEITSYGDGRYIMARVSIVSLDKALLVDKADLAATSNLYSSDGEIRKYLDGERDPIHVHLHDLARGEVLRITPTVSDCVAYVWQGCVLTGEQLLDKGSSLVIEHGATLQVLSKRDDSKLVTFYASAPSTQLRPGGHVHVMPNERVPRFGDIATGSRLSGAMHANSTCPTCSVWLHENSFAPPEPDEPRADAEAGIHSHAEDEVIFVTAGQMRLGTRLYAPGLALAVAADTMYSFTTGPEGLSFINFRPDMPRDIQFKNGRTMDEVGYWREKVTEPQPVFIASN